MVAMLKELDSSFRPQEEYEAYVKRFDGKSAQSLRHAAAEAVTIRIRISPDAGKQKERILPLTPAEVKEVREILAETEESPALDYSAWLRMKYAGPMSVIYTYFTFMEFISDDGKELESFNVDRNYFGDAALVEHYRTQQTRPALMLPTEALKRWQSLPCFDRLRKALEEMTARDAARNR